MLVVIVATNEGTYANRLKHDAKPMIYVTRAPTITDCLEATPLSSDLYFS